MEIIEHVPGPGSGHDEGISRRDLLTTAARLGAGLAIGAAALGTGPLGSTCTENTLAAGAVLQLYNDKPIWTPWINAAGRSALKSVGVGWKSVPYADTTTYQASIRTSARTSRRQYSAAHSDAYSAFSKSLYSFTASGVTKGRKLL